MVLKLHQTGSTARTCKFPLLMYEPVRVTKARRKEARLQTMSSTGSVAHTAVGNGTNANGRQHTPAEMVRLALIAPVAGRCQDLHSDSRLQQLCGV